MGTTTNNGWPTPVATDLVKDGWEAIKDLGDAIDTTVGTYAPSGLIHINTTSVSAVSSQSFNNVFSATYDNYKIIITGVSSSGASMVVRLRAAGSDNSTANSYVRQIIDGNNTTVAGSRATSTSWDMAGIASSLVNAYFIEMVNPFKASATGYVCSTIRADSGAFFNPSNGTHNQTVSYDGFTILPTATFTGSISIYGYKV